MTKFRIRLIALKFHRAIFVKSVSSMKRPACSIKLRKIPMRKNENLKSSNSF